MTPEFSHRPGPQKRSTRSLDVPPFSAGKLYRHYWGITPANSLVSSMNKWNTAVSDGNCTITRFINKGEGDSEHPRFALTHRYPQIVPYGIRPNLP